MFVKYTHLFSVTVPSESMSRHLLLPVVHERCKSSKEAVVVYFKVKLPSESLSRHLLLPVVHERCKSSKEAVMVYFKVKFSRLLARTILFFLFSSLISFLSHIFFPLLIYVFI